MRNLQRLAVILSVAAVAALVGVYIYAATLSTDAKWCYAHGGSKYYPGSHSCVRDVRFTIDLKGLK